MGGSKRLLEHNEEMERLAREALVKSHSVRECQHGTLMYEGDLDADNLAYAIGTNMLKAKGQGDDRGDLMPAIKRVIGELGDDCGYCQKLMAD